MARASRKAAARGRSKGGLSVNWGEAQISNRLTREGTYVFKITKAEEGDNNNVVIDAEVVSDKQTGKTVREYYSLEPQALWKLANLMTALGIDIPDSEADLDLEEFVDKEYAAVMYEHTYNDKTYLRAKEYMPADEAEDDTGGDAEEVEEKPAKGAKGAKASKKAKEPELLKAEDVEAMDRDDLTALIEEHELDVDPEDKSMKRDSKLLAAVLEALEEKELLETEEEEVVEEKPAKGAKAGKDKGAKGGKSKLPKMTASEIEDMNEEELEDLLEKYGIEDVDLSTAKTLRKKAALVLDALEEKDLLESE